MRPRPAPGHRGGRWIDGRIAGILEAWQVRRPELVTVIHQPNAGPGAARNRGLDEATGDWVTFTDPDDMLDPGFFDAATAFLRAHPDVELLATKPLLLTEGDATIRDRHPRSRSFAAGSRVVDLRTSPSTLAGSSTTSLYPLARLRAIGLRFEPRLRPTFEDGHFAARTSSRSTSRASAWSRIPGTSIGAAAASTP